MSLTFRIAQMTLREHIDITPSIVNSHPFPMATMIGWATIPPMHEQIFRTTSQILVTDSSTHKFEARTGTVGLTVVDRHRRC